MTSYKTSRDFHNNKQNYREDDIELEKNA